MSKKKKPKLSELTGSQSVTVSFGDGVLSRNYSTVGSYSQLRTVRKDSTVALARGLLISCIQAGSWNIETDECVSDDVKSFVEHILPLREEFLYNAIAYGRVDFGWCGFEKIFEVVKNKIQIKSLKPLLHDMTSILVTPQGHFNGYRQRPLSGLPIDVPLEKCFHIAFGVEGGNLYGSPLLENIRAACDDWSDCNDGAKRYDLKVAGSHWVVKYPPGTGTLDGESVDNGVIAAAVLAAMESSGSVAIPTTTATVLQEIVNAEVADLYAWHVELLDDKAAKQSGFKDRLAYLDSLKVRGLIIPERSILEGTHGTKAEAGEHIGMAVTNMEQIDKAITSAINEQLVNQLIKLNYGPEMVGKVRLVCLPLVDTQVTFLREVYKKLNDNDLDVNTLRDKLDLPTEIGGSNRPIIEENEDEQ